ncbi:Putative copper export protein [Candidatus Ornithobacterium hominis]|uniref:Copper export protein n=1 Tax=Candidatus Ornithobacterium hominis TaxID=2497989 RepID=A0A383TW01_9FLAO|nr:CopD family protein [Candidatus Ornithobacterium hominis]MCT7903748.1 CopD family protein [Candidatus Ornithobacterium hominis]CAI9428758.1 Copper export protein [Candidatus Ornithobacterium hominis]SZD71091.1 Putative copper export protein [Candidatus Ornithobacterium hominis]SZD71764.1 Putative copper export protein [Candidatus Ornithobacterium hominis]
MSHHLLLVLHLIGACIWVGGHLVLSVGILPEVYKKKDISILLNFEKKYEKIGMPALLIMLITGVWMAYQFGVPVQDWFQFKNPMETAISIKIILLLATLAFALSAQIRVIPHLSYQNLNLMTFHIISVTILSLLFLITGTYLRYGGVNF